MNMTVEWHDRARWMGMRAALDHGRSSAALPGARRPGAKIAAGPASRPRRGTRRRREDGEPH